ncbi:MAG: HDOD domain-containing protein [Thermodesulfovibrionales bacterium]|nr:HDOD domain-containing protein [Thermodesulfovibrionales bacterium]
MATEKGSFTSSIKIFNGIAEKELALLYNSIPSKRLKSNEILIKEGSPIICLFVVVSGQLEVFKETEGQRYSIGYLEKNGVYGSLSQDKDSISPASLLAQEPSVILCIDEKSLILVKPDIKNKLLHNIASVISKTNLSLYNEINFFKQKTISICQSQLKDYERLRSLVSNSKDLLERLKKIPSLPPYSYELSRMLMQEKISTDKIADFIKTDPSLMAIVLKTVNSPYYNLSQKVSDFHHALLLLGFNQIYQVVMDNSLNNVIPNRPEFIELKDEAMIVANISFEIALLSGFEKPIILSTIGTLHVIGKAIKIFLKSEEEFSKYILLYDDAIISEIILKEWKLPDLISTAISYYKYPEFTTPESIPQLVLKVVSILHLSKYCFDKIVGADNIKSPFIEFYLKTLGLNISIDEIIYKKLLPTMRKKIEMLPRVLKQILEEKGK